MNRAICLRLVLTPLLASALLFGCGKKTPEGDEEAPDNSDSASSGWGIFKGESAPRQPLTPPLSVHDVFYCAPNGFMVEYSTKNEAGSRAAPTPPDGLRILLDGNQAKVRTALGADVMYVWTLSFSGREAEGDFVRFKYDFDFVEKIPKQGFRTIEEEKFFREMTFTWYGGGSVPEWSIDRYASTFSFSSDCANAYQGEFDSDNLRSGSGTYYGFDGDTYKGEWQKGKRHGKGIWNAKHFKYEGDWKDDKQHGKGSLIWASGSKYVGEFKDDRRTGQGTYTWSDGGKYVGEWKDNNRHGEGTQTWSDGGKYVGEWKDDKKHGQGTLYNSDGSTKRQGWWCKDRYSDDPCDQITLPSGGKYTGDARNGRPHGQGTVTNPDGSKYAGEWQNGTYHGQGTYAYPNGNEYVGEYEDGKKHGQGTFTFADGGKYVGMWQGGKRHGQGTYTGTNGYEYVGNWVGDKLSGQGTLIVNGRKLVGEFLDNRPHGKVTEYNADGSVKYTGLWCNGKPTQGACADGTRLPPT